MDLDDADVVYETDLAAAPFSVSTWVAYAASKADARARAPVYERALARLPGSYKLWRAYLGDTLKLVRAGRRRRRGARAARAAARA